MTVVLPTVSLAPTSSHVSQSLRLATTWTVDRDDETGAGVDDELAVVEPRVPSTIGTVPWRHPLRC